MEVLTVSYVANVAGIVVGLLTIVGFVKLRWPYLTTLVRSRCTVPSEGHKEMSSIG